MRISDWSSDVCSSDLTEIWITSQEQVRVSDPERTIIDGLDHPQFVGGVTEVDRGLWMKRDTLRVALMIDYALRLGVGAVIRRLGYLLEFYGLADAAALVPLRAWLTDRKSVVSEKRVAVRGDLGGRTHLK